MTEEWRRIEGFDYEVSDAGRVRRTGSAGCLAPYKVHKRNGAYLCVDLYRWGRRHHRFVHRLVAAAFLPPPRWDRCEVNHMDANAENNEAGNLEWCTRAENEAHKRFWYAADHLRLEEVPT